MAAVVQEISLKDLRLNNTMSRRSVIESLAQKCGDLPKILPLEAYAAWPLDPCIAYLEEFLFKCVKDEVALPIAIQWCFIHWDVVIIYYSTTADEDLKQQLVNWMVGNVTDTIFNKTKKTNDGISST